MDSAITCFESTAMAAILSGDDPDLELLRRQSQNLRVKSRDETGVGFFTEFCPSDAIMRLRESATFRITDTFGDADELEGGFGLILYVYRGSIETLEAYTFQESWPTSLSNIKFSYLNPAGRDFEKLKKVINSSVD